jgi:hypothetical protein
MADRFRCLCLLNNLSDTFLLADVLENVVKAYLLGDGTLVQMEPRDNKVLLTVSSERHDAYNTVVVLS